MLSGIVGTTYFFLDIEHKCLNMSCTQGILPVCCIRDNVTISLTFNVVVVLG